MSQRRFLLGCDLAKTLDFTSFAIIEMEMCLGTGNFVYHLRALDRIRGVDYPKITNLIISAIERLEAESNTEDGPHLCLDASGLGAPIRDYLRASGTFTDAKEIYPVVFTGGESKRYDRETGNYNISKTLIISNFLSLQQHGRFDYAPDLPALPLLMQEIDSYKRHQTASGHTGFDSESGAHDDLICAICIPLIIAEWKYNSNDRVILEVPTTPICRPYKRYCF